MKTYRAAPMDGVILGITIFVLALLVYVGIFMPLQHHDRVSPWLLGLMAGMVAICWQLKPARYEITSDAIKIIRGWPFVDIAIPLSEVHEVGRRTFSPVTLRTFGVGGLFSSTGYFWNSQLGSFFATITNRTQVVLIDAGRKFVISPENPDEFIADLESITEGRAW